MTANAVQQFSDAIRSAGLTPPEAIEADGKLRRFASNGKRNDDAGWYVLHDDDIPAGSFGDWRTGLVQSWRADVGRKLTQAEEAAHRAKVEAMRRQREAEEMARHAEAAKKAAAIWQAAQPAADDHAYLVRKNILAHGTRVHNGALAIPVREGADLHSLQFISPDGDKRFLPGGRVARCYYSIGTPKGATALCIAEGFATGATIHEATGHPVAVAFNAGNLEPVARALRAKFPELALILCADNDAATDGNPGLTKATEAARAVGGLLAVAAFGTDRPEDATDFNDLARLRGPGAVRKSVAAANAPAMAEHQPARGIAAASDSAGRISYRRASEIQAKPIRWLWQGRIARGKVAMLAGNPGLGKSQVTVSMAAVVSTGGTWPVDRTRCERGNVIFLSAEDDPADTIRPRLEAVGADLSRVFVLDAVVQRYRPDGDEVLRAFNLKADLGRLGRLLAKIGDVALIVIDPITAYLGDADSYKNAEIRALLAPLADLAAKHGAAVVCVSHLNKSGGAEALMRVTGSMAFVAAARSAWLVAKDLEDDTRRLFLPMKNNVGNNKNGLAFAVQSAQVKSQVGLIETSRVMWEAEAVTVTADEAMASQCDPEERSAVEEARQFLAGLLADGPVHAGQIKKDADGAGFNWRTVQRAADRLGVVRRKEGMRGGWVWNLAPKMTGNTEGDTQIMVASSGSAVAFVTDSEPVEVEI